MRKIWLPAALLAAGILATATAQAQVGTGGYSNGGDYGMYECDPCADYGGGGGHHCHHKNRRNIEGLSASFNCGCNGSYKYPVPPLYTYHWPGQYSQQLMTDYHSPWRFPPLKPYTDELPVVEMGMQTPSLLRVQPASATTYEVRPAGEMEAMSDRMLRVQ